MQRVLIVGSGGREDVLARACAKSPDTKVYVAPGISSVERLDLNIRNQPIPVNDIKQLVKFAQVIEADLVVIGPELPLSLGLANELRTKGIPTFGPNQVAARLETSKVYAKHFMDRHEIPTAPFEVHTDHDEALASVAKQKKWPVVIKADGLAQGKGVRVCNNLPEAEDALHKIMVKRVHGSAGEAVVIEDYLDGTELSVHVLCRGLEDVILPTSQDYKRLLDGDDGPNTGGMGALAPVPWVTEDMIKQIRSEIIEPTLRGVFEDGEIFSGCLYCGLMIHKGRPYVLEYNVRFGDPETQVVLPLIKNDMVDLLLAFADDSRPIPRLEVSDNHAVCVNKVSQGYAEDKSVAHGYPITGIDQAEKLQGVTVYHAGAKMFEGRLVSGGGRELGVTAVAETLEKAHNLAYMGVDVVKFDCEQHRTEIAKIYVNQPL